MVGAGTHVLPITLADAGSEAQEGPFVMTIVGIAMMIARFGFGAVRRRRGRSRYFVDSRGQAPGSDRHFRGRA